ncbi:MAG: CBS domain-containing protein [Nitrospirota bacterium]
MIPKVKSIMTKKICQVGSAVTVQMAAKIMADMKIGSLLVERENAIIGIVTETDFARKVLAQGLDPSKTKMEQVMSTPVFTIDVEESLVEANQMMEEKNVRHLAVTEEGKMVGILSVRDLLHPIPMGE